MVEWHENLKTLRAEQRRIQVQNDVDKETLTDLDGRQQILKADVDNLRERAAIQQRLKLLETSRPFAKYRQARLKVQEAKELKKKAQNELQALEQEVEPSLRAVNAKQDYSKQVEKVVHARKKALEDGETHADRMVREQRDIHEKFQDLEREVAAEKEGGKARKQEIVRIDAKIKSLQRQMEQEPVDFDPAAYNERIREKVRRVKEMQLMVSQLRDAQTELKRQSAEKAERVRQMETELQELDSQVGQQAAKLRQRSQDTARAWEWIQNNQDMFEHPVFGPPIVECSVTDSRYVDAIESLFGANDLLTFTVQSNNDFKKLGDQLYGSMKLAEITIRTSTIKLDQFKPPVSAEQRATFGFDGWALDFLAGPDPVLAMMCSESRAHSTGIALNDISSRQYEALERSPITTWTTGKASYQIVRRAEYGPSATSTRVRELAKAKVWTNQPVDMAAKTELRRSIDELKVDRDELARQIQEASQKILEIQQNARVIDGEKKVLEEEKAAKQRAQGEFRALPAKLAQLEDDIAAKKNSRSEAMIRLTELHERIDERLFEKCDVGLRYAVSLPFAPSPTLTIMVCQY